MRCKKYGSRQKRPRRPSLCANIQCRNGGLKEFKLDLCRCMGTGVQRNPERKTCRGGGKGERKEVHAHSASWEIAGVRSMVSTR